MGACPGSLHGRGKRNRRLNESEWLPISQAAASFVLGGEIHRAGTQDARAARMGGIDCGRG